MNTVHVTDVSGAAWALAEWMAGLGRKEADSLAGEEILSNDKSKIKEGTDLPDVNAKLIAPLFNLVSAKLLFWSLAFLLISFRLMTPIQHSFLLAMKSPVCSARHSVSTTSSPRPWRRFVVSHTRDEDG